MSRIHEALLRAEIERRNISNPDAPQSLDRPVATPVCDPLPIQDAIDLDSLPHRSWTPNMAALPTLADSGNCVEQFRSLRSHLHLHRLQKSLKTILVSSGLPAEGKTFVAVNLVMSLAHNSNRQVLLIDADLRRPAAHTLLGASPSPGLADYLQGKASIQEIIQRSVAPKSADIDQRNHSNVAFISAGNCSDGALELICSHRIDELISQLAPLFEWVIVDSPPVLVVSDAVDLARAADAVLLVARAGSTPYAVAQNTQRAFSNSRLLGFVLNASKEVRDRYSYYDDYMSDSNGTSKRKHAKESRK
jgi:protein-tyrosine kinase